MGNELATCDKVCQSTGRGGGKAVKRKVLYVFMRFPAKSEAFAAVEVEGILKAGWQVSVACLRTASNDADRLRRERGLVDLEITHGGLWPWVLGMGNMLLAPMAAINVIGVILKNFPRQPIQSALAVYLLPRAFGIASEAKNSGVDVVHLFWGHYPSLVGIAYRELGGTGLLSVSLGAYDLLRGFLPTRCLSDDAVLVTHAEANKPDIAKYLSVIERRVNVIYRGTRIPSRIFVPQREIPRVLVAERLTKGKKTVDSLRVMQRVLQQNDEVVMDILGEGPERQNLERWVLKHALGQRVRFHGHVDHQAVQEYMNAATVFLSMSQAQGERLPNVVKEAMAMSCVVIVTQTPGINELVIDNVTGFVVQPGAVDIAAKKLLALIADPESAAFVAQNGRKHVQTLFDVSATTLKRLRLWTDSINERQVL